MSALTVGVVRETAAGERRVALTPDAVARLQAIGLEAAAESGAGASAWFPDEAYAAAGARVADAEVLHAECDVLVCVHPPERTELLRAGQVLIGLLQPLTSPQLARDLAAAKVTAISLDGLPRTLSRAQAMDVLSSQANVAGYKAALVAADTYGSYFPMLMTAAGTMRPATVLVVGAGVAGLQAIGTARRLGAVVTGYDVREAARADVLSTGASFLDLGPQVSAAGTGAFAAMNVVGGYVVTDRMPPRDEEYSSCSMSLMIVCLILVRWLTCVTVRPARSRALARAPPMLRASLPTRAAWDSGLGALDATCSMAPSVCCSIRALQRPRSRCRHAPGGTRPWVCACTVRG
jgi:hypothetical protein